MTEPLAAIKKILTYPIATRPIISENPHECKTFHVKQYFKSKKPPMICLRSSRLPAHFLLIILLIDFMSFIPQIQNTMQIAIQECNYHDKAA